MTGDIKRLFLQEYKMTLTMEADRLSLFEGIVFSAVHFVLLAFNVTFLYPASIVIS